VSFSTTSLWDKRGRIANTLAALSEEPVRVLLSTGDAADTAALPSNVTAQAFVPHGQVLPLAALMVTHCGHGSVTACLAHGVPLVGLPNPAADQPFLAKRIEELGAGVALPGDAGADEIRTAARNVLGQPSFREAASGLGAVIRSMPGASGAAIELEALSRAGSRLA
jgi:MGT family glycosyltransferase